MKLNAKLAKTIACGDKNLIFPFFPSKKRVSVVNERMVYKNVKRVYVCI